jgi:ABC-type uncharacterized transport system fused permease/ATPase subunit
MTAIRDPEPPLEQSIRMIKHALDLAYYYQNDSAFMPSAEDLSQFVRLSETLFFYLSAANHMVRRLHERAGVQVPILNRPPFLDHR